MSTVHINICRAATRGDMGGQMPVLLSQEIAASTIVAGGISVQGAITAPPFSVLHMWSVQAGASDIMVKFGADPTAVAGAGHRVPAYGYRVFGCGAAGEKIAVIEVA